MLVSQKFITAIKLSSKPAYKIAWGAGVTRVYQHDQPSLLSRSSSGSLFAIKKPTLQKGWTTVFLLTLSNISAGI